MRHAILALVLCLPVCAAETDALTPIFNGKDLSGWKAPDPNPFWTVVDGVLVGTQDSPTGKGHVLETQQLYGDVTVELEARWTGDIDSGIFLRKGQRWQCQIGISISLKVDMTCSVYIPKKGYVWKAPDAPKLVKDGDWNKIRIEAKGTHFKIWLNGVLVNEHESEDFNEPGPIGLQIHPGKKMKIEFRNIRAKNG